MCWCFFRRPKVGSVVYVDDDWKKHMWEAN